MRTCFLISTLTIVLLSCGKLSLHWPVLGLAIDPPRDFTVSLVTVSLASDLQQRSHRRKTVLWTRRSWRLRSLATTQNVARWYSR
ncbi:hypothetical protein BDN71DRAFT_1449344 [Pleurotus eryngii]|uniref:Secreted protein n=1 Tax=Pleurotus eryngii TaxID=5323 RepID=A0A9P6D646_PLEER|nr:hypothetical protein BDN71DRAFT_1449344 [Pleurotus eryngii]